MAAKKETAQEVKAEEIREEAKEAIVEVKEDPNRKVKIKLFRDNDRYTESVYVAVNGESYMVPRGVEVEVPEYIAQVLENSMEQDQATAERLMKLEVAFSEKG